MISVGSEVRVFPGPPFAFGGWFVCGLLIPDGFGCRVFAMVGAVAQLGEHLLCKQGVSGSIPLSSTKFNKIVEFTVLSSSFLELRTVNFKKFQTRSDAFLIAL